MLDIASTKTGVPKNMPKVIVRTTNVRNKVAKRDTENPVTRVWLPSILPLSRDEKDRQYTSPSLV